jgi:hypothetical protein
VSPFALSLSKGCAFLQEEMGFDKLSPNGNEQGLKLLQKFDALPISAMLPYIVKHVGVAGGTLAARRKLHIRIRIWRPHGGHRRPDRADRTRGEGFGL